MIYRGAYMRIGIFITQDDKAIINIIIEKL